MKKQLSILLILIIFLSLTIPPGSASNAAKVFVNGVRQQIYPYIKDGVVYIPANPMAMALGVSISWNPNTRILKVDNKVINTSPLDLSGKLYLPLESVAAAAGATVEWDGTTSSIKITRAGHTPPVITDSPPPTNTVAAEPTPPPVETPASPELTPTPRPTKSYAVSVPGPPPSDANLKYIRPTKTIPPEAYSPALPGSSFTQPTGTAYKAHDMDRKDLVQPRGGAPRMPSNLMVPPLPDSITPPVSTKMGGFTPKSEMNDIFRVTVTNLEYVDCIKDYYKAKPDFKYVIVYLSQQNVSDIVQVYTGRFSLLDQHNTSYDYIEALSNFWLVILRPNGTNFGYLVFEIPSRSNPSKLVLHGLNKSAPLILTIR